MFFGLAFGLVLVLPYRLACAQKFYDVAPAFEYRNRSFFLDGKPFRFIGGSIHYFRIHPMLWEDRLMRVRSMGINTIQFYIPWNYHETEKGKYNFVGSRDVVRFIKLAAKNGLKVLLRLGPYVCGEWENGGLPWWLLLYKDLKMRTSDPRYTNEVKKWFDKLLPILLPYLHRNGGPILMAQVENEYGSFSECDHNYTEFLRNLVKLYFGPDVLQYTTDGPSKDLITCGSVNGTLTTIDFGPSSNETVDKYFSIQRSFAPDVPLVNSEYYAGWFTLWGQQKQSFPSTSEVMNTIFHMHEIGASFAFYMLHGGTNFGFWNGAEDVGPVITSYDYAAPLTEYGDTTPLYIAIRNWISGLKDWSWPPKSLPLPIPKIEVKGEELYYFGSFDQYARAAKLDRRCRSSVYPLSFEQIRHPYGYVIYSTTLESVGTNLTIPLLKDFGFVFMNSIYQGVFVNKFKDVSKNSILLRNATSGSSLSIVVENQGRQTYETINDYKGILSNVTLDGKVLKNWLMCGINLKYIYEWIFGTHNLEGSRRLFKKTPQKNASEKKVGPGIFFGTFTVPYAADTFFDATGWHKGMILINGVNLGRYWPSIGPQVTLYTPAPVLQYTNNIVLIELQKPNSKCYEGNCSVDFLDHPIFRYLDD
uniref:Beta-galactosidase n=1 Tax=Syphacia muris TaxID=451379 RepID=A0A0N5AB25_9BILA